MFCLICDTQLPENARFCSSCGNPVNLSGVPLAQREKNQLERELAEALLDGVEQGIITLAQMRAIAKEILPDFERLTYQREVLAFLRRVSDRWSFFTPLYARYRGMAAASAGGEAEALKEAPQSDEQSKDAFEKLILSAYGPIMAEVKQYLALARTGPITQENIDNALKLLEKAKELATTDPITEPLYTALLPFARANDVHLFFRKQWYSRGMDSKVRRKTLSEHWGLYLAKGMDGLIGLCPQIGEQEITELLYGRHLRGLGQWLEDTILKLLLLGLRLERIRFDKEQLIVATSHFEYGRLEQILDFVNRAMEVTR